MDKQIKNAVSQTVEALVTANAASATKFISPKLRVTATRRRYQGKIVKGNIEVLLVIGKPNAVNEKFIKQCKKAGEPFPIKKMKFKFPAKK